MKHILIILFPVILFSIGCSEEEMPNETINPPTANFEMNQTVEIASTVTIDGSSSMGQGMISYTWSVTDPLNNTITLDNNAGTTIRFDADIEGTYDIALTVTNAGGSTTETGTVMVLNPSYATMDQMGRPAINTVFNFFGDAATKNGYNQTIPEGGNVDPVLFEGILDALQGYIGLDPDTYSNALGLDNATTASVLATDVLSSNKDFPTTYGPSDLNNIVVGQNVLNGRGFNDDVVDVTLILAFGADLTNLSSLQQGLISDNVQSNDVSHDQEFPYLAQAN